MNRLLQSGTAGQPATAGLAVRQSLPHDSAIKHVTGSATYIDDILEPAGLLHVYFGTSRCAHGRIRKLDLSKVLEQPGVVAVVSAKDLPGLNDFSPMHTLDEEIFASETVHFQGQVLFAVAAEDRLTARRAATFADIEIEALPAILDIDTAMEQQAYVDQPHEMKRGDAQSALSQAEHRFQGEIVLGGQDHFYLEGQAAMSVPQEDGDLLVYSSSQHPSELQHLVAQALGRADHAITVEVRRMVGPLAARKHRPHNGRLSPPYWPTKPVVQPNCVLTGTTT